MQASLVTQSQGPPAALVSERVCTSGGAVWLLCPALAWEASLQSDCGKVSLPGLTGAAHRGLWVLIQSRGGPLYHHGEGRAPAQPLGLESSCGSCHILLARTILWEPVYGGYLSHY